jgi:hypothetical protein
VVHRFDDLVYYRRIEREAFRMLSALRDGSSISDAIESATPSAISLKSIGNENPGIFHSCRTTSRALIESNSEKSCDLRSLVLELL